jgi:hypothetical protein
LWSAAGKLMLTVFCASQGPMCEHYLQVVCRHGMRVTSAYYSDILQSEL